MISKYMMLNEMKEMADMKQSFCCCNLLTSFDLCIWTCKCAWQTDSDTHTFSVIHSFIQKVKKSRKRISFKIRDWNRISGQPSQIQAVLVSLCSFRFALFLLDFSSHSSFAEVAPRSAINTGNKYIDINLAEEPMKLRKSRKKRGYMRSGIKWKIKIDNVWKIDR